MKVLIAYVIPLLFATISAKGFYSDIIVSKDENRFIDSRSEINSLTNHESKLLIDSGNDKVVKGIWTEEWILAILFIAVAAIVTYRRLAGIAG